MAIAFLGGEKQSEDCFLRSRAFSLNQRWGIEREFRTPIPVSSVHDNYRISSRASGLVGGSRLRAVHWAAGQL
jgi:hypothetical protein